MQDDRTFRFRLDKAGYFGNPATCGSIEIDEDLMTDLDNYYVQLIIRLETQENLV